MSFSQKARIMAALGIDFMRVIRFTRAFSRLTAKQFIHEMLAGQLQVSHIVTGEDFIFGYNRGGNRDYLAQELAALGIGYTACPAVLINGERCSSTQIRKHLVKGDMTGAASLLGYPYIIIGRVRHGDKRGRELGFPTANILPADSFPLAKGVYAVRAEIEGAPVNGIANLGMRPTFDGKRLQLEVHLFDWQGDLYGKRIGVSFLHHIRNERKFEGVDALIAQIHEDVKAAKAFFSTDLPQFRT